MRRWHGKNLRPTPQSQNADERRISRRRTWKQPLFGHPTTTSCRSWRQTRNVRLDQMVPATCTADLDDVHGEFFGGRVEGGDLFCGTRRPRHLAEPVAEHPGHQRDLLLAADRAQRRRRAPVKLRGAQQVGIRVAHVGDGCPAGVDIGQSGPTLQGVVDDLAHMFQRTSSRSGTSARTRAASTLATPRVARRSPA